MGVDVVTVDYEGSSEEESSNKVSLKTKMNLLKELKDLYTKIEKGKSFTVTPLKKIVSDLVDECICKRPKYNKMTEFDHAYSVHSLNVGIMALLTGMRLEYNKDKLINVTLGALLHDIGKAVDEKNHCEEGYKLLKDCQEVPPTVYIVPTQHHISNLKANCHEFSKIISICNTYDNLLDKGLNVKDAIKEIVAQSGLLIEEQYIKAFLYSVLM